MTSTNGKEELQILQDLLPDEALSTTVVPEKGLVAAATSDKFNCMNLIKKTINSIAKPCKIKKKSLP